MKNHSTLLAIGVSAVAFANVPVHAQDGAELYNTKACTACHGAEGKQPTTDAIPKLAGQNKAYLLQQFLDIKSGARNNGQAAQMKGIAANVSDEEAEAITEYLSGL